jgi:hypothetical protein
MNDSAYALPPATRRNLTPRERTVQRVTRPEKPSVQGRGCPCLCLCLREMAMPLSLSLPVHIPATATSLLRAPSAELYRTVWRRGAH